jgi:serine/threonine protein phosphatase PrpC
MLNPIEKITSNSMAEELDKAKKQKNTTTKPSYTSGNDDYIEVIESDNKNVAASMSLGTKNQKPYPNNPQQDAVSISKLSLSPEIADSPEKIGQALFDGIAAFSKEYSEKGQVTQGSTLLTGVLVRGRDVLAANMGDSAAVLVEILPASYLSKEEAASKLGKLGMGDFLDEFVSKDLLTAKTVRVTKLTYTHEFSDDNEWQYFQDPNHKIHAAVAKAMQQDPQALSVDNIRDSLASNPSRTIMGRTGEDHYFHHCLAVPSITHKEVDEKAEKVFVIAMSDGIFDQLTLQAIGEVVSKNQDKSAVDIAGAVRHQAELQGAVDNLTAAVIKINPKVQQAQDKTDFIVVCDGNLKDGDIISQETAEGIVITIQQKLNPELEISKEDSAKIQLKTIKNGWGPEWQKNYKKPQQVPVCTASNVNNNASSSANANLTDFFKKKVPGKGVSASFSDDMCELFKRNLASMYASIKEHVGSNRKDYQERAKHFKAFIAAVTLCISSSNQDKVPEIIQAALGITEDAKHKGKFASSKFYTKALADINNQVEGQINNFASAWDQIKTEINKDSSSFGKEMQAIITQCSDLRAYKVNVDDNDIKFVEKSQHANKGFDNKFKQFNQ